ncbi:MAG: type II toxin-antitoxin system VapB family antitoxin [Rhodoferax sp.]|nr:type II toxin-antitoxin system VapB family antitoxin [Rhodoferax sp.]
MRTNIEIDDKLMADAMEAGGHKTKREAVEAGLRLVARRKVYDGLLALRGKLHWDDSDEGWAKVREQQALVAKEAAPTPYVAKAAKPAAKTPPGKRGRAK